MSNKLFGTRKHVKLKIHVLLLMCLLAFAFGVSEINAQSAAALSAEALAAYNTKEFAKSAELYKAAIQAGDQTAGTFYNAACSFALTGKTDEAFRYLEQAVARGFTNVEHLKKDADLTSLHSNPRWQKLTGKLEAQLKEQQNLVWNQKTFWDNPALNTPYKENLSEDEKILGISKLWSEVKNNFSNFDLVPDVNWDAVYAEFLPKARRTKSTIEYYRVLQEMSARLRDGHTDVAVPNEIQNEISARPAIRTRLIEDKVLIVAIYDSALKENGIEIGQEVLKIDDMPVKQYTEQRVKPYQSVSTEQMFNWFIYELHLLGGSSRIPVKLTVKDASGKTFEKTLNRLTGAELAKLSKSPPPFEFKMLPGNIAYVALNTFGTNQAAEMFEKNFDEIAKSNALIIDVRENGGGNSPVGYSVLSYLTDKPFKTWGGYMRQLNSTVRAWGQPQSLSGAEIGGEISPNGKKLYTKPVVVLTSPRTASAAEDFTVAYSQMKRGSIIGEPTAGSTGQPLHFSLPGGGAARVTTMRLRLRDGREFIGKGVQPDKLVSPTVADFCAGFDTVLEAAIKKLKEQI